MSQEQLPKRIGEILEDRDIDDLEYDEDGEPLDSGDQDRNRKPPYYWLRPTQYKKGQSGNPSGRPPGISLKEYAKLKLASMNEEEREEFFNGLPKEVIWKMAEGNPVVQADLTTGGEKIGSGLTDEERAKIDAFFVKQNHDKPASA